MERVFHLDAKLDLSPYISQSPPEPIAFNWIPNYAPFRRAEACINRIMEKKELTVDDKKNLQVAR